MTWKISGSPAGGDTRILLSFLFLLGKEGHFKKECPRGPNLPDHLLDLAHYVVGRGILEGKISSKSIRIEATAYQFSMMSLKGFLHGSHD